MESFTQTLQRLADAMSKKDAEEVATTQKEKEAFDEASSAVLKLCTLLDAKSEAPKASPRGGVASETPTEAAKAGRGWMGITDTGLANLYRHFSVVDADDSGQLSIVEIDRMLRRVGLGGDEVRAQIVTDLRKDDEDGDETSFDEFAQWFNTTIDRHFSAEQTNFVLSDSTVQALNDMQTSMRKVGYGGTSWRTFQNTIWLMTQAVMIIAGSTIFVGIVWFRFILVPMTMAYFLTFLIGPIIDVMTQRPLICMGKVLCKINKLPPDKAAEAWKQRRGKRPLPHISHLEYPYDEGAGACCHARPPMRLDASDAFGQVNNSMHQWLTVGKLPFPLALGLTIVFIFFFFRFAFLLISNDIQSVLQDGDFMDAFEELLRNAAHRLKHEAGIIVTEFEPATIRKNLEGNTTCEEDLLAEGVGAVEGVRAEVINNGTECIQVILPPPRHPRSLYVCAEALVLTLCISIRSKSSRPMNSPKCSGRTLW